MFKRTLKRTPLILAAALCLAALAGCRAPNLQDRMDDSARIFRLNIGWGPGFLVNVQVTRPIELGFGAYEARRCGFRNGHGWIWDERRYDGNLIVPLWGWEDVDDVYYGSMPKTTLRGDDARRLLPDERSGPFRWADAPMTLGDENRGWLEVAFNVHIIYVGIEAGVDVGQLVDYVAGWFGWDPLNNDKHRKYPLERHGPNPTPPGPGP